MIFQSMPHGTLLYKTMDVPYYVVVAKAGTDGFWLVEDGWSVKSLSAGPFSGSDILRATRLANTLIPDGCERGPWRTGIGLFSCAPLPAHVNEWSRIETEWLDPSITFYDERDLDGVTNELCCAPKPKPPRVRWAGDLAGAQTFVDLLRTREQSFPAADFGLLTHGWNCHPAGSAVLATHAQLDDRFAIVDCPTGECK